LPLLHQDEVKSFCHTQILLILVWGCLCQVVIRMGFLSDDGVTI
jgi:hypothetical protein